MKQLFSLLIIVSMLGSQLLPMLPVTRTANPLIPDVQAGSPALEPPLQPPPPTPTPTPIPPPREAEPTAPGAPVPDEISNVPGVTEDWWAAVQEQIQRDMYGFLPEENPGDGPAYRGHNQAHNLALSFGADGVSLAPAPPPPDPMLGEAPDLMGLATVAEPPPDWQWELRLTGYGPPDNIQSLPEPTQSRYDSNRLEYRHDDLIEWYVNDERGLEQGFTLDAPPPGAASDSLVLEMALNTDLRPLAVTEQTIEFTLPDGNVPLLRYSDLLAYDAAGTPLPARMELTGCKPDAPPGTCRLRLVIDTADALYPLTVDPLLTSPDWSAIGEHTGDLFGYKVASAGDVNGDGYDDLAVGAYGFDGFKGKAYVYHGSASGLSIKPDWTRDTAVNEAKFGWAIGTAGDVNGDGFDDLVAGAPYYGENDEGQVYVYHGSPTGLSRFPDWMLASIHENARFGFAVGTAGDVNGDGFDDLIAGGYGYNNYRGRVWVYAGSATGLDASGDHIWARSGERVGDKFGRAVGTAGDLKGDGYDDIVIGALEAGVGGKVYVYYGSDTSDVFSSNWADEGEVANDFFGDAVGTAGDVNGDGYDDLVVAAGGYDYSTLTNSGKVYVYHGSAGGLTADTDPAPDWTAVGEAAEDEFGYPVVGTAGDVNGDGFSDLVVGARKYGEDQGKAYLYYGSDSGLERDPGWSATGEGDDHYFGVAVAATGDINGDGYADLVVGADGFDTNRGKVYLFQGTALGLNPGFDWTTGGQSAGEYAGVAVNTASDVNGDGFSDLVVGAHGFDNYRGKVYLFLGAADSLSTTAPWVAAGEAPGHYFGAAVGPAGDVNNDGFADLLVGAWGYDSGRGKAYLYTGGASGLGPPEAPVWSATGENQHDRFGAAVASVGNVNGDGFAEGSGYGYDDLLIGAHGYPAGGGYGKVYLFPGAAGGPGPTPAWSAGGEHAGDQFGRSLAGAGDVNRDGCPDLAVGAWQFDNFRGKVYVYHGCAPTSSGLGAAPAWTEVGNAQYDYFGWALNSAGDFNGDGYSDLAVGAWGYENWDNNTGIVYVYYGNTNGIETINPTKIFNRGGGQNFGFALASAGDVNGDGYADLIVGDDGYNNSLGRVFLYHGGSYVAGRPIDTANWSTEGRRAGDHFGAAVATAGDINGDGYSDLVVGAWGYDSGGQTNAGRVYLFHGAPSTDLRYIRTIEGDAVESCDDCRSGAAVATARDVNGDGFADVIIGVPGDSSNTGAAYLYLGSRTGLPEENEWNAVAVGQNPGDKFGSAVGTAGDVNGDGYSDLVISAPDYNSGQGKVYVYHGSATGVDLAPAFTVTGTQANEAFGQVVGAAGDVNGDGYADLIIGGPGYDSEAGRVQVYFGSQSGLLSSGSWMATGEQGADLFGRSAATAGDVNGDGFADLIIGAPGAMADTGKVYVYYGSLAGPGDTAIWTASGEGIGDRFGSGAGTVGDANGDGFADVVIAADGRDQAYIYHGSALGLDTPFTSFSVSDLEPDLAADSTEMIVAAAGDVNGDGFADLAIGTPGYDYKTYTNDDGVITVTATLTDSGKIYVLHGSAGGLLRDEVWSKVDKHEYVHYGTAVGTAGDVNGDGFADLIAGSPDFGTYNHGRSYVYYGNNGGGRVALTGQTRGDGSGHRVQPWGPAYTPDSLQVELTTVNPMGRGRARLQAQVCPPGVPFGHPTCRDETSGWLAEQEDGGFDLQQLITGLEEGELYRWRVRPLYNSPLYSHGPWRRLMGQALEGDVRITRLAADLTLAKTISPAGPVTVGQPVTFTLTYNSNGPARDVLITDWMPTGISSLTTTSSWAAITETGALSQSGGLQWQVQDLEAGQGGVITISGIAQYDRFVNTALIIGSSPDPNLANNRATAQTRIPGIIYVDATAGGQNNGLDWNNAYTDLQDALAEAEAGDQVWVAAGVYKPTATNQRHISFQLKEGISLHGGFAGVETELSERPTTARTILSGDIGTLNNSADNVYHVISASQIISPTLLEGITIMGGRADGVDPTTNKGGGLYLTGSSGLLLLNVTVIGNRATWGGGIYNDGSSPALVNVAFSGNSVTGAGGGMYNLSSSPVMTNVTFSLNNAGVSGGGMYNAGGSQASLSNSILWGNMPSQVTNDAGSGYSLSSSNVQGLPPASGNIKADPQFVDADGPDNLAGTLDDDLRLHTTVRHPSPVIDAGNTAALPPDSWDLDGDGDITEPLSLDLSGRWRLVGFNAITPTVDMGAYEATILDVLAAGQELYEEGLAFRMENLQLLSADTLEDALQNYANFNDGEWFYAFCDDYGQIDDEGYCDALNHTTVRDTLLDSIDLYRVAVGWPTESFTPRRGPVIPVWQIGGSGVLSATGEIANVHLIFGNEFLVDATDYRFSTGGIPYADQIIAQELAELEQAQRQFELIMELVVHAFNEWQVGDYCTTDQFEQFGVASSLLLSTLNEIAARYYMLGQSQNALSVYEGAFEEQYLHLLALDEIAAESESDYLQDGSWEMLNNLSQLRARAQAIQDGLDFFGFAPDYVPLQAYQQLLQLAEGPAGSTGLLGTARDLEDQARDAQRNFDTNASDMSTELDNLTVELNDQLFELCGDSPDDFETCDGGLMGQNFNEIDAASLRVGLAWLQAQNIAAQIKIEQERAGQTIIVHIGLGQDIAVAELAIGKLEALRTTLTGIMSSEVQFYAGVEAKAGAYSDWDIKTLIPSTEYKTSLEASTGFKISRTWAASTQTAWDPTANAIRTFESLKALKQAEAEADIEGANSTAVIRNLLLQQSEALEEYEIAMAEFNTLAAEHNYLAQLRSRLLNKRYQAVNRVANHNSHLLNPAYRIWRDSLTTQSLQAHALAAQFAYLTARAAEYNLLTPYPNLNDIFRARTSNDIRLFLDGLKVWVQALDQPGQLNRYPYTISLAKDVWGLTDEALDPDGLLSQAALRALRYQEFQARLQGNVWDDRLEIWFSTLLEQQRAEDQYLFSPNIWNNRIAGIGEPLAQNQGLAINLVTNQTGVTGEPEVVLIHGGLAGGAEQYRNAAGEIVYYDPDTAVPVGYQLPSELDPEYTTVVLRPGINGVGAVANGGLFNLSVAASSWVLRIPADSRGNLNYSQIEDIEIVIDSTGRALPGQLVAAQEDSELLIAGSELEPTDIKPVYSEPQLTIQSDPVETLELLPSVPGAIGGNYFGSVMVTSPITLAIQVLNLDIVNDGGNLTGAVNGSEASLYRDDLQLVGTADGDGNFSLSSQPFTTTVAGRTVTQTFTLTGHIEEGGDIIRADYSASVSNLLPRPILVQGSYSASRPGAVGSKRLSVEAGTWWLPPGASTAITVTMFDETMQLMTDTPTDISFSTGQGTVSPAVVETSNGVAVATFTAGASTGQATIFATTGEITDSVRIQVGDFEEGRPVANFSASPLYGSAPLEVIFANLSTGIPTDWLWDFGDGIVSSQQNPVHTYVAAGSYTVTLTISNTLGTDVFSQANYITVTEPYTGAQFIASTVAGPAPLKVTFIDLSTDNPTEWLWDFGDGGSSTLQHPVYTYTVPGSYSVTLVCTGTAGVDVLVKPDYIKVAELSPANLPLYLPIITKND